jgi:metallo-beta-lactamase class B
VLPFALLLSGCAPAALPSAETRSAFTPQQWAAACPADAGWDEPGPPFRVHGNSWYVGTCGIAAVLITHGDGHVLIDSGTVAGAEVVAANIRRLGFRLEDVKVLLMSHEHHDHTGGMAALKAASGARLIASSAAAPVMASGTAAPGDPQFGMNPGFAPVVVDQVLGTDGRVRSGALSMQAIATPGHTPGALSWQWRSCDGADCRTVVFADSLSAISSDTYRFSDHPAYVAAFRGGLARLASVGCDMLLTPHPSASGLHARAAAGLPRDGTACAAYAEAKLAQLETRLAKEATR